MPFTMLKECRVSGYDVKDTSILRQNWTTRFFGGQFTHQELSQGKRCVKQKGFQNSTACIHHTVEQKQQCHVGDPARDCKFGCCQDTTLNLLLVECSAFSVTGRSCQFHGCACPNAQILKNAIRVQGSGFRRIRGVVLCCVVRRGAGKRWREAGRREEEGSSQSNLDFSMARRTWNAC